MVSPRAAFLEGKVFLVGDELATFRPTTGQSTNQAARKAVDMCEVLEGRMGVEEWERKSLGAGDAGAGGGEGEGVWAWGLKGGFLVHRCVSCAVRYSSVFR